MGGLAGGRARRSVAIALLVLTGCSSGAAIGRGPRTRITPWITRARFPVAPVALPDGGLLYGERLTGRIRAADTSGQARTVAMVPAVGAQDDQRGLLGLTRTREGRTYASWTGADRRLVVGTVPFDGSPSRIVWTGPVSAARANGGTLALTRDDHLLVGIGDLLADRRLGADPAAPNRKVLELDPAGPATQRPRVLSTGWNNPYALVVTRDGAPWVADNAGGRAPERIGRADRPATAARRLRADRVTVAPAGLVAIGNHRLGVCGFVSGRLDEYRTRRGEAVATGRVLATPCRLGAAILRNGRLVTLTPDVIRRGTRPLSSGG